MIIYTFLYIYIYNLSLSLSLYIYIYILRLRLCRRPPYFFPMNECWDCDCQHEAIRSFYSS